MLICLCNPVACREQISGDQNDDQDLAIITTVPPHAWLVEQIAGDLATVHSLLLPGVSPATYQPTDAQVTQVMRAAIYFRTGVPAEHGPWFNAIEHSGRIQVVDLRDSITLRHIEGHQHHNGHEGNDPHSNTSPDPHIWLSPQLLKTQAATITHALTEIDPTHAREYAQNLASLNTTLDELDTDITAILHPFHGPRTGREALVGTVLSSMLSMSRLLRLILRL